MTGDGTAVFFDADGTVLSFPDSYAERVHAVTEAHLGVRDEAFEATYSERFLSLLGEHASEPYRRAFEHALAEHGYDGVDVRAETLVDALLEAEIDAIAPPDGVRDALAELRARGWAVGVLTNGVSAFQRAKLRAHDLDALVDAVVVSDEAGAHKPDAAPFELAAERLPAASYVMVGDSYEADVEGARGVGWRGVHYAPDGDSPDGEDALESFDDLLARLD
jgi:putative hydrolase of the HAD superfamily